MIAITSKCWLAEMWQMWKCENVKMWKCENVTNDYKWLRILKKFLRSYVYEWRGTPMLCPKSPHRLRLRCQYLSAVAVNICRLLLSISVGCRCQYLSAVAVNICRLSLSKFDTVITVNICHCFYYTFKQSEHLMQSRQSMQSMYCYCRCCSVVVVIEC